MARHADRLYERWHFAGPAGSTVRLRSIFAFFFSGMEESVQGVGNSHGPGVIFFRPWWDRVTGARLVWRDSGVVDR